MANSLIVVESPTKVKTIKKFLGKDFHVLASMGHIKDLPKSSLGIDLEKDFEPTYHVIETKKKTIADLKKAAKDAENIYLAPDPDREGEAIAWHIADVIGAKKNKNVYRVLFNDLTKNTVLEAIQHPLTLNFDKYEAQQTRILDPSRRLPDQPDPVGKSQTRPLRRTRAVGGRAHHLRAGRRDQPVCAGRILESRGAV